MEAEPEPGVSERYEKTSVWPALVAFGLVLSEIGILFALYPVAVGGLVIFVGALAAVVDEAGYVASPWRLLSGLGLALVVVGLLVVSTQVDGGASAYLEAVDATNRISLRGYAVAATGLLVAGAGAVLPRVLNQ